MNQVLNLFYKSRVVPVITVTSQVDAIKMGQSLLDAGMISAELTFRHNAAPECLRQLSECWPQIIVGAGTILTLEQAKLANRCGARFIVTPAFNLRVVDYCLEQEIPVIPGVCTPYEVELAMEKGLRFLKFFPAQAIGISMLKAFSGPYSSVVFMPTGGITGNNIKEYLNLDNVAACGTSWPVQNNLLESGDYKEISRRCRLIMEIVQPICKCKEGAR